MPQQAWHLWCSRHFFKYWGSQSDDPCPMCEEEREMQEKWRCSACNIGWNKIEDLAQHMKTHGLDVPKHPLSARFHAILADLGRLHDKKQADYGRESDPFANVRGSADFGVEPWVGAMIRANDKIRRLQKAASGGELVNESVIDSFNDLAVYAIIARVLYEEAEGDG